MSKELEPFQQEAVDKIKSGVMDGYQYEYETKNPYTNENNYHEVRIENGEIKDVIVTTGKSFDNKENVRYTTEPKEKPYKTDNAMWKFIEKAPYRFKKVLDSSKFDEYNQRKVSQQAAENAERLKSINTQSENSESDGSSSLDEPDSTKKTNLFKSLALIILISWALYFVVKLMKKAIAYFRKRKESKSEKNKLIDANPISSRRGRHR